MVTRYDRRLGFSTLRRRRQSEFGQMSARRDRFYSVNRRETIGNGDVHRHETPVRIATYSMYSRANGANCAQHLLDRATGSQSDYCVYNYCVESERTSTAQVLTRTYIWRYVL